jgi:hypothetical protein
MKFIKDVFKMLNDPDGLLNVLGIILLCMLIVAIIGVIAVGFTIYRLIH